MATIGVFLALGGGAYAAINLPNNSVGTRHIKPNAVGGGKVKNNSLSGSDIRENTFHRVPLAQSAHLLDGRTATSFQTFVNGACADRRAIQDINADGSVKCIDLTSIEGRRTGTWPR